MKEIKNYLHLYLGCEAITVKTQPERIDGHMIDLVRHGYYHAKPILRSLRSMTDDEYDWLAVNILGDIIWSPADFYFFLDSLGEKLNTKKLAETTAYLLCQRFDIFGLIEAGLAIEATA